jgi:hypothetical protein
MNGIIAKRELLIKNKIFTTSDILSLIKLFISFSSPDQENINEDDFSESYNNTTHSHLEFTFSDHSIHTLKFEEFSIVREMLEKNKIIEVSLFYSENLSGTRFVIKIRESDTNSGSGYVIIERHNSELAVKMMEQIEDLLSTCKDQPAFVKKFRIPIIAITDLILMFFLFNIVELFIRNRVIFPRIVGNMLTNDLIFVVFILCIIAATPSLYIFQLLDRLFPEIELQTGRNPKMLENGKRYKLWIIISVLIIPAVVSYLLRLL